MTFIAMIAALMITFAAPVSAEQYQEHDEQRRITVNGDAVVNVTPDKIVITCGIETWDPSIIAAKQKNNTILNKATASIKELGVAEKDIQTDNLSIEPRYKDDYSKESFLGYFVRNTFVVTLKDTAKVEALVTRILQSSVNYIHGIDFETTELKKYREQARELALKAAREKAEKMAMVLGQTLGDPIQITESITGPFSWYYSGWSHWGTGRTQGMIQNVMQEAPRPPEKYRTPSRWARSLSGQA